MRRGRDFTGPSASEEKEYDENNNEENKVAIPNMPAPDSRVICCLTRVGIGIGIGFSVVAVGSRKQNNCGIMFRSIMCSFYKERMVFVKWGRIFSHRISMVDNPATAQTRQCL